MNAVMTSQMRTREEDPAADREQTNISVLKPPCTLGSERHLPMCQTQGEILGGPECCKPTVSWDWGVRQRTNNPQSQYCKKGMKKKKNRGGAGLDPAEVTEC